MTLRKVVNLLAPRLAAASSTSLPMSASTGSTVRTTNGRPMNISAMTTPAGVNAICTPSGSRYLPTQRSEEHTYELQSLMRISYAVFCLKQNTQHQHHHPK